MKGGMVEKGYSQVIWKPEIELFFGSFCKKLVIRVLYLNMGALEFEDYGQKSLFL
jgi:hypothetical protein